MRIFGFRIIYDAVTFTICMENSLLIFRHFAEKGTEGTIKSSKPTAKKGQVLGSRKALNDITNKSSLHPSVSTKKKSAAKEEFNIAGEKFLHDHTKCIEANQKAMESSFWETVFPKHGIHSFILCDCLALL
ncbi:Ribonuclease Z 2 like [Heracleum sosnowskyi]|uniref:Ribonuclease Z 2 like n=1 Tax=Heracleum sosnowskyi TaxID=360622 RepID=A0AAD8NBL7_9APIA|nr:Ribonuclease Z 2 like [Heracleum sosnowskyi]